jgi:hypothetical protein
LIPASFEFLWVEGNFRVQRVRLCWVEGRQQKKKKKKKKKSLNSQREASSGREQSFANQLLQAA